MLTRITIQNFQSLRDVRLEMGRFTALVGRSSSGKSAVVRALQLLAHNARGTAYVTEGESTALVAATFGSHAVAVRRGARTSEYVVNSDDAPQETYTKCGTSVPDEVAALMRFAEVEGTDLNFAGQFDPPFLLNVPGTKVAKVLGDLTQVNLLYEASREANRRRREVGGKVKAAKEEIERLRTSLQNYRDLKAQGESLQQAREARQRLAARVEEAGALRDTAERLERATRACDAIAARREALVQVDRATIAALGEKVGWVEALTRAAGDFEYHDGRVRSAESEIERLSGVSVEKVQSLIERAAVAAEMRSLADRIGAAESKQRGLLLDADELAEEAVEHRDHMTALLVEHGVCPTCGQNVKELTNA